MNISKTLYISDRKVWRKWLQENFEKEKEIWLIYPKKSSNEKKILYNNAVEEALCFGWIDSTIKKFDENHSIQRFSPRRIKSQYSQQNKERIKWLLKRNLIHPSQIRKAKEITSEKFVFPKDILEEIKKDDLAWKNYKTFSETYRRIRTAYIDHRREDPKEFKKRLENFIKKTKANKKIGFGGIDKYD